MKAILDTILSSALLLVLAAAPACAQTPPGWSAPLGVGTASTGSVSTIVTGGVAVIVFPAGFMLSSNLVGEQYPRFSVCDILNPPDAKEPLYLDLVTTATIGGGSSLPLSPGQAYRISKPVRGAVTAVAASSGHSYATVCY